LPLTHGWVFNRAHYILTPLKFFGPAHNDVLWDMDITHRSPYFKLFGPFRTFHGQHDKQVHVAIRPRLAASMGAKKDNPVWVERRDDLPDHLLDLLFH